MTQDELFTISAADLADLVTHAATASSAAADDNKRRERDAWAKFDAIVERVRSCPADITDFDDLAQRADDRWAERGSV